MEKKLIILAAAAGVMFGAYGKTFSLDLRSAGNGGERPRLAAAAQPRGDGTLRAFDLDAGVADVGAVAFGDELTFTLFDDVALTLTLKEKMPSPLGGDVFLAEVAGYDGIKSAVVLRTTDGLTIDVQDFRNDKVYKVISMPTGVRVSEIKPSHEGKCGCDALVPPASGDAATTPILKSPPRLMSAGEQSDTCVDILVAYDKNAAAYANSNGGGITNFAQIAVQKMNVALANTRLDEKFRFRLVGVAAITVSESDVHEALYALNDDRDGWKMVKTIRDAVGADIVTTLIDTGTAHGTTGVGWSLSSESAQSAPWRSRTPWRMNAGTTWAQGTPTSRIRNPARSCMSIPLDIISSPAARRTAPSWLTDTKTPAAQVPRKFHTSRRQTTLTMA